MASYVCQLCFNATPPDRPRITRKVFGLEMYLCARCTSVVDSGGDVDAVMGEAVQSRTGVGTLPSPILPERPVPNRRVELKGTVVGELVTRAAVRELEVNYKTTCDICGREVPIGSGFHTAETVLCEDHVPVRMP